MYKIKMHSFVDVITNSSTVIYTYQDACVEPLKELINEFARIAGFNKTADEMFDIFVEKNDLWRELDRLNESDEEDLNDELIEIKNMDSYDVQKSALSNYIRKGGDISEISYDEDQESTSLVINPKHEDYNTLAVKIIALINSPTSKEGYE